MIKTLFIKKHQLILIGAFFMCFLGYSSNEKISISSNIWFTLKGNYRIDSTHHLKIIHHQRRNTDPIFDLVRMDNGLSYRYNINTKWHLFIQEFFVLKAGNQQELLSNFRIIHSFKRNGFTFNKKLSFDWFHHLNESDNPNVIRYDLGRVCYQFYLSKKINFKKLNSLSPFFQMHLFQIQQLTTNDISDPYENIFFDMTRFFIGINYANPKMLVSAFAMRENVYFGRDDDLTLQIIRPTYGMSFTYYLNQLRTKRIKI